MIRTLQVIGIVLGMHIVGSAILFGYMSGPMAMLAAPMLSLFGWFFIFPEICGVGLQWLFYDPYPKPTLTGFLGYAAASAIVGGIFVGLFVPKEQGNEANWWFAGFLAGAGAAVFSFLCIHVIRILELKTHLTPPNKSE